MRFSPGSRPVALLCTPLIGALLLLGMGAARAEEPPAPSPAPAPAPAAVPERLGVEMPLTTLIELVAQKTGASFTWDPSHKVLRERSVTLTREQLKDAAVGLPLLRRTLSLFDQALVPMGEPARPTYAIMDARTSSALMRLKAEVVDVDDATVGRLDAMDGVFVTATVRVRGLATLRDLRMALARMVTGNNIGSVTEVPDADVLIVTDFAPSVAAIYRTVRQTEHARAQAPEGDARVRTVALGHARAVELAALLTQTFAPTPPILTPAQAQAAGISADRGPRILADERTNQLVVAGTPGEMHAVMAVVTALDVPAPMR